MTADPYAAAPPLAGETLAVIRLLTAFGPDRPLGPPTTAERREMLLRTAALLDRLARTEPRDRSLAVAARQAGDDLASFDQLHGTSDAGRGSTGRRYTRRAYALWIARPRTLPN
jgi:hypothetical protein